MSRRKSKKKSFTSFLLGIIFLLIVYAGYFVYNKYFAQDFIAPTGEISFHFMALGNEKAGDCVYVKAGKNDILIDAGSDYDSVDEISSYINRYVTDGTIEYLIVTHAQIIKVFLIFTK